MRLKNENQLLISIFIHRFLNIIGFPKLIGMLELLSGAGEISGLEYIANLKSIYPPDTKSSLVLVGHGMGANILFTALQQIFEDRFFSSSSETFLGYARGFGDLVVLLNPTFEASRYSNLYELSLERCSYFPGQKPKLAVLTSESDNLTKYVFPIGRFFSTMFRSHQEIDIEHCGYGLSYLQSEADRTAIGHFAPFVTHKLNTNTKPHDRPLSLSEEKQRWAKQVALKSTDFSNTTLISLNKTRPHAPFLNIKVDSELMHSHEDMWNVDITQFVKDLILLTTND